MATSPAIAAATARFKALPRQQQLIILFGIPVLIAGTAGWFTWKVMEQLGADPGIYPFLRRDGGKWAEISALNDQIAEKQKTIDRLPEVEARIADIQDDIHGAEDRLPREAEKAQMRETIDRLARDIRSDLGQVVVKSVRIVEAANDISTTKRASLRTVVYQTEVAGDLNGLIAYIDAIEKNTRFMSVNQITWKSGGVTADLQNRTKLIYAPHSVRMDLVTYVYTPAGKGR